MVAIGPMNVACQYCKEFVFKNETPGLCFASGQVKLMPLVLPPEPLHSLVSGNRPDSKHYLTHIQHYNNCFQITSFGATKVIQESYMPTFKIQGQIYHLTDSLLPMPNSDYIFLQLYFMGIQQNKSIMRVKLQNDQSREFFPYNCSILVMAYTCYI
jgi:hypothetical protein